MRALLISVIFFSFLTSASLFIWNEYQDFKENYSQSAHSQYQKNTNTHSVPVQKQYKGEFNLENGISLSNEFDGARLNGVALTNDSTVTVLITPENEPVNPSPWYAFKIWSEKKQNIYLKFTYPDGVVHRYHPKVSSDGLNWNDANLNEFYASNITGSINQPTELSNVTMKFEIGPDTLWIAAHEIVTSKEVKKWIDEISIKPFVSHAKIGSSHEGKAIYAVSIVNETADNNIIVLSRQHASEVAGYLAMKSFIETLIDDSQTAQKFRSQYNVYLFPHVNPDGADNGHWRHNAGGIDLNRDWGKSKQPETLSIKHFLSSLERISENKYSLAIDFFSAREDILYISELKESSAGLTLKFAESTYKSLSTYNPKIKERSSDDQGISAESYFYEEYGIESLAIIINENSSVDSTKEKGKTLSLSIMQLMTRR